MVVVLIDEPGSFLGKKSKRIVIKRPQKKPREIPVVKISEVIISTKASLSTDAIRLLANNNIPILFIGRYGPVALLHPFFMHGTVLTRREQMKAHDDWRGLHLAKSFVKGGMINKARLLQYFAKSRKRTNEELASKLVKISEEILLKVEKIEELDGLLWDVRYKLMGLEGEATHIYYEGLAMLIPKEYGFKGREKRPPTDPVNAALSFGYTILNGRVLSAIARCGLEPFAGYLHTDRSGKPSLILDLSEEFRQPIVDRTVVSIFSKRQLNNESEFTWEGGRVLFSEEGKKKFLEALEKQFRSFTRTPTGAKTSMEKAIFHQARNMVRFLLGRIASYEPYIWKWWDT